MTIADTAALLVNGRIAYRGSPDGIGDIPHSAYLAGTHEPSEPQRS